MTAFRVPEKYDDPGNRICQKVVQNGTNPS